MSARSRMRSAAAAAISYGGVSGGLALVRCTRRGAVRGAARHRRHTERDERPVQRELAPPALAPRARRVVGEHRLVGRLSSRNLLREATPRICSTNVVRHAKQVVGGSTSSGGWARHRRTNGPARPRRTGKVVRVHAHSARCGFRSGFAASTGAHTNAGLALPRRRYPHGARGAPLAPSVSQVSTPPRSAVATAEVTPPGSHSCAELTTLDLDWSRKGPSGHRCSSTVVAFNTASRAPPFKPHRR